MTNICSCGALAGYQHAGDCPFPWFGSDPVTDSRWANERESIRGAMASGLVTGPAWVTPTHDEKMAWAQFAQMQYRAGNNELGHRYSAFASMANSESVQRAVYDTLQRNMQQGPA